jgi:integrase
LAALLSARYLKLPRGYQLKTVAKALIGTAGSVHPRELTPAHVTEVDQQIKNGGYAHSTRHYKSNCLRAILRWLWEEHGAPKLDAHTSHYPGLRPRNVTATDAELDRIMQTAPDFMRLLALLCSDLAIRSGTAAKLGPEHYDPARNTLRFETKYGAHLALPVTSETLALILQCDLRSPMSFVRQLQVRHPAHTGKPFDLTINHPPELDKQWRNLLATANVTRRITPHDLRRTTAVSMLEATGDIRDVQALLGHRSLQSTVWYLDHDLRPVQLKNLERIKRNARRKELACA